jgi:hypothetical protein
MDDLDALSVVIFLASTFAASFITGLAGFAFGIIAAGPWLHVLKPAQAITLIVRVRSAGPDLLGVEAARGHQTATPAAVPDRKRFSVCRSVSSSCVRSRRRICSLALASS